MKTFRVKKSGKSEVQIILEFNRNEAAVKGFSCVSNNNLTATVKVKPKAETNYSAYFSNFSTLMISELMDE